MGKYVDHVVPVDFSNTYKMDAWKKHHFDCHFSGNDHGSDWDEDLKQYGIFPVYIKHKFYSYKKVD